MPIAVTALGKGLRVEWVDFYGDLTMHSCLSDDTGQRTEVCIDGRSNSPTRYHLFQQARHPCQPGAALVELGTPEEGIVVPLLSQYLDSGGPKALGLTEYSCELARETLLHLGEPVVSGLQAKTPEVEKPVRVRHEVVDVTAMHFSERHDLLCCQQYPTGTHIFLARSLLRRNRPAASPKAQRSCALPTFLPPAPTFLPADSWAQRTRRAYDRN